ncbi:MAG: hypothetical protein ABSA83_01215 [Verrucomicrobiota bacterium]
MLRFHFTGAADLARNTNVAIARAVFAQPSTIAYEYLVLNRLAVNLGAALHFQTKGETVALLRPLLDDLLRSESMAGMGGAPGKPINFVLAVQLDPRRTEVWQQNLKAALRGPGEVLRVGKFSGQQWNKGAGDSFWIMAARDWMLVGRGGDLTAVRSDYLQRIQKFGRPGPELITNWFEADVDWPQLANWFPLTSCPLKLARTAISISAEPGSFYMTGHVLYPEPVQWQARPMSLPTHLVREPLLSFATGQNVEPYLKSDGTLSRICTNPLGDQFYFWSMSEVAFQSYAAWPVNDSRKTMLTLSTQAIDTLNPKLHQFDGTKLDWLPKRHQLLWARHEFIDPVLNAAPTNDGQFLVAHVFPLSKGKGPAPKALWEQIQDRTNLVYYDWELTGPRAQHLLTMTEEVPILRMLDIGPREPAVAGTNAAKPGSDTSLAPDVASRLNTQKQWLLGLAPFLANTVTEVTRTSPKELTVVRNSSFVFSSLELVLLSHWLADTPAGPLDWSLLPQAKMSSGMPARTH